MNQHVLKRKSEDFITKISDIVEAHGLIITINTQVVQGGVSL